MTLSPTRCHGRVDILPHHHHPIALPTPFYCSESLIKGSQSIGSGARDVSSCTEHRREDGNKNVKRYDKVKGQLKFRFRGTSGPYFRIPNSHVYNIGPLWANWLRVKFRVQNTFSAIVCTSDDRRMGGGGSIYNYPQNAFKCPKYIRIAQTTVVI